MRRCPSCGSPHVETVDALRAVGTCGGRPVLELQATYACTECEWIRSVKGEDYRRRLERAS